MAADDSNPQWLKATAVGRPRKLSSEAIVNAAIEIADESGAERVSIRALASRLKVQATAIYTHFENLEAIEYAVVEKLLLKVPPLDAGSPIPLKQQLIEHFLGLRSAHVAHPRISTGRIGSPAWNRNAQHLDDVLKQLAARGVDMATAQVAYSALSGVTVLTAALINVHRGEDASTAVRRATASLKAIKANKVLEMMALPESKLAEEERFRNLLGALIDGLLPRAVARAGKVAAGKRV